MNARTVQDESVQYLNPGKTHAFAAQRPKANFSLMALGLSTALFCGGVAKADDARFSDDFVNFLGIHTDPIGTGDSVWDIGATRAKEMGFRHFRAGYNPWDGSQADRVRRFADTTGAKVNLVCGYGFGGSGDGAGVNRINELDAFYNALGSRIESVEGANEINSNNLFNDPVDNGGITIYDHQLELYNWAKPKGIKTLSFTFAAPWPYSGVTTNMEDRCDYGAIHPYNFFGNFSYAQCAQRASANLFSDYETDQKVRTSTNGGALKNIRKYMVPNKPIISTEAGYSTDGRPLFPVGRGLQAKGNLRTFFEHWNAGIYRTYLHDLFDRGGEGYGILNSDGSYRQSGQAIRNLTTLLKDTGTRQTGSLNFSIAVNSYAGDLEEGNSSFIRYTANDDRNSETTEVHRTLLRKSDGKFLLVLWVDASHDVGENTVTANCTINLSGVTASTVRYVIPTSGTTYTSLASNTSSFTVNVPDSPMILEITPATSATPTLTDTGFESQTTNTLSSPWWKEGASGGVDRNAGKARTGSNNAWLATNGSGWWSACVQRATVKPNTTYTFRVYARGSSNIGTNVWVGVRNTNGGNKRENVYSVSGSSYGQISSKTYTTGASETQVDVYVGFVGPSGSAWLQVDDASLS